MVSKSLDFAYKMTYQTKRAGDDLVFGGRLVNNIQDGLNKSPLSVSYTHLTLPTIYSV